MNPQDVCSNSEMIELYTTLEKHYPHLVTDGGTVEHQHRSKVEYLITLHATRSSLFDVPSSSDGGRLFLIHSTT